VLDSELLKLLQNVHVQTDITLTLKLKSVPFVTKNVPLVLPMLLVLLVILILENPNQYQNVHVNMVLMELTLVYLVPIHVTIVQIMLMIVPSVVIPLDKEFQTVLVTLDFMITVLLYAHLVMFLVLLVDSMLTNVLFVKPLMNSNSLIPLIQLLTLVIVQKENMSMVITFVEPVQSNVLLVLGTLLPKNHIV
jgi:hypothetical protein